MVLGDVVCALCLVVFGLVWFGMVWFLFSGLFRSLWFMFVVCRLRLVFCGFYGS